MNTGKSFSISIFATLRSPRQTIQRSRNSQAIFTTGNAASSGEVLGFEKVLPKSVLPRVSLVTIRYQRGQSWLQLWKHLRNANVWAAIARNINLKPDGANLKRMHPERSFVVRAKPFTLVRSSAVPGSGKAH